MTNRPLITGTIYPPDSRLKVAVKIYATRRQMLKASRTPKHGYKISNDTMAFCETEEVPAGHLAVIFFSKNDITKGIVAHEMLHAAFGLMARRRHTSIPCTTGNAPKSEEEICTILDGLVDAFHKKFSV